MKDQYQGLVTFHNTSLDTLLYIWAHSGVSYPEGTGILPVEWPTIEW